MGNSDICPSCGMGKRASEETPEKVKEESSIPKTTRHIQNNDVLPSNNSGLGILGKMIILIGLGLITGMIMALAG